MGAYFESGGHAPKDGHWRYDFQLYGHRYRSRRGYPTRQEALDAEHTQRTSLRRQAAGLELPAPDAPRFGYMADAYLTFITDQRLVSDPDTVRYKLTSALRFFGAPPDGETPTVARPYHDLTLRDVITDARWLVRFDSWMAGQGYSGPAKNRLRSACSRLYWFAMLPQYREETGITVNPFRGILRDVEYPRELALDAGQIRAIAAASPPWLHRAIGIAVLAPKLRLGNILALQWAQIDPALHWITVAQHKTRRKTRRSLVAPISPTLAAILRAVRPAPYDPRLRVIGAKPLSRFPGRSSVYTDKDVGAALADACQAAGIVHGRAAAGVTFHTFRHSALTILAGLGIPDGLRKNVAGHLSIQTTQGYTHLQPVHEHAPLAALAAALGLELPTLVVTHYDPVSGTETPFRWPPPPLQLIKGTR